MKFTIRISDHKITINDEEKETEYKRSKGLNYICSLLLHPQEDIPFICLFYGGYSFHDVPQGSIVNYLNGENSGVMMHKSIEISDEKTIEACISRLIRLTSELAYAKNNNDYGRVESINNESEQIEGYLRQVINPKSKTIICFKDEVGKILEAMRLSVKRSIGIINKTYPDLAMYLKQNVYIGKLSRFNYGLNSKKELEIITINANKESKCVNVNK